MGVSSDWNGAINVGTGCNSGGSCATGGPNWDGRTPFSRAEINFWGNPGKVWYDISQVCLRLRLSFCVFCAVLTRLAPDLRLQRRHEDHHGRRQLPGLRVRPAVEWVPGAGPERGRPVELVLLRLLLVRGRVRERRAAGWRRRLHAERRAGSAQQLLLQQLPERVRVPGQRRYVTSVVFCMVKRTDLFRRRCWVLARELCGLHVRQHGRDSDALPGRVEPLLQVVGSDRAFSLRRYYPYIFNRVSISTYLSYAINIAVDLLIQVGEHLHLQRSVCCLRDSRWTRIQIEFRGLRVRKPASTRRSIRFRTSRVYSL
jgi:hypothetical protein